MRYLSSGAQTRKLPWWQNLNQRPTSRTLHPTLSSCAYDNGCDPETFLQYTELHTGVVEYGEDNGNVVVIGSVGDNETIGRDVVRVYGSGDATKWSGVYRLGEKHAFASGAEVSDVAEHGKLLFQTEHYVRSGTKISDL